MVCLVLIFFRGKLSVVRRKLHADVADARMCFVWCKTRCAWFWDMGVMRTHGYLTVGVDY